jgi:hypothetical protein
MFGDTPTVNQRFQDASHGVAAAGQDADLVVDEVEVLDEALIAAEVLPERVVERVHRAVALAHGHDRLAVDAHLDGRLRNRNEFAERVVAPLDQDAERIHLEELRHIAERAPREQLEGGFGRLIGVAVCLALLHLLEEARDPRVVLGNGNADALELGEDV